ncbi:hypothetical protein KSD_76620 [Ktedonobacter sp. SOSP1-85]|nr:hypothetical protein KSD_76620 [Ktedonobacter sp. SOSP1-85]
MGYRRHVLLCGLKSSRKLLKCLGTVLCHNNGEENDIEFYSFEVPLLLKKRTSNKARLEFAHYWVVFLFLFTVLVLGNPLSY